MARKKDTASSTPWDQIEIGDQVKHAKWGVGTVLFRSGMGDAAKAIVVFPEEGQKKLMLKYAGLEKVGTTSLKSVEKLKAEVEGKPTRKKKAAAPKPKPVEAKTEPETEEEDLDLDLEGMEEEDELSLDEDVAGFDDDDEDDIKIGDDKKNEGD